MTTAVANISLRSSYLPSLDGKAKGSVHGGHVNAVPRAVVPRLEVEACRLQSESESDESYSEYCEDFEVEQEEIILVEANARVTNRMAATEKHAQDVARLRAANPHIWHAQRNQYWIINAESREFAYFVNDSKEAIQILCHAFV
eukprot:scaffold64168_cov78-Attheya_sp.AAC.1